jgi:hypothetical protein
LSAFFVVTFSFKIWHYAGAVIHEWQTPGGLELWEAKWQTLPVDMFAPPTLVAQQPVQEGE